ncbi:MAG: cytochrome c [Burkholderiales bacterium]|uniref:c-type cytochrome n=1 Tax=Candidatus Aalborgicola defluviihabitans TaxID=3386187 RepID=UPI001D302175|nr:cytochrome c [Burkholderiales bacterium]MBK6569745.1 cytochrome c [Burkholderiales bacterium]MBL0242992.1 cytochrome c [Rhodoferax sp.]
MHGWVKRLGLGLGLLVVLGVAILMFASMLGQRKRERSVDVAVQGVAWATDATGVERGHYLYRSRGCAECHGPDGSGREFINDGKGMRIRAPNITVGGPVGHYTAQDWERVVRHGVKANGRAVFIMPSEDYNRFTDADLAAVVGYVRTIAPRTGGEAVVELPLPVKALYGLGVIRDASEKIDHHLPPAQPVAAAVNAQHGAYVANMCIGCHGPGLSGGTIPGGPPDWPAAANLTPGAGSAMLRYGDANTFVAMLRSGKRPDGSGIKVMPFQSLRELNDTDAHALYTFLKTVPPRNAGQR